MQHNNIGISVFMIQHCYSIKGPQGPQRQKYYVK